MQIPTDNYHFCMQYVSVIAYLTMNGNLILNGLIATVHLHDVPTNEQSFQIIMLHKPQFFHYVFQHQTQIMRRLNHGKLPL